MRRLEGAPRGAPRRARLARGRRADAWTSAGRSGSRSARGLRLVGAAVGSFLNVVIARVPEGESIVRPRSRCPSCRTPIAWHDNVPVVSWLLLRGRCRRCGVRISPRYLVVELLGAGAALARLAPARPLRARRGRARLRRAPPRARRHRPRSLAAAAPADPAAHRPRPRRLGALAHRGARAPLLRHRGRGRVRGVLARHEAREAPREARGDGVRRRVAPLRPRRVPRARARSCPS